MISFWFFPALLAHAGKVVKVNPAEYNILLVPVTDPDSKEDPYKKGWYRKCEFAYRIEDDKEEILKQGLATPEEYALLEKYTLDLFERGTQIAAERGLILVDTKYEFGKRDGKIYLMDEIHTPDSSRYFYAEGYEERFTKGEPQKQLSKEFVREWLMENGFQGKEGQHIPEMTPEIVTGISERYIELFEHITGEKFVKAGIDAIASRIEVNVKEFLKAI